jgi:hypothetical protein
MRGNLRQGVLAAAEAYFQPDFRGPGRESRLRVGCLDWRERQKRQRDIEQALLPRPQPMAAGAAI